MIVGPDTVGFRIQLRGNNPRLAGIPEFGINRYGEPPEGILIGLAQQIKALDRSLRPAIIECGNDHVR